MAIKNENIQLIKFLLDQPSIEFDTVVEAIYGELNDDAIVYLIRKGNNEIFKLLLNVLDDNYIHYL